MITILRGKGNNKRNGKVINSNFYRLIISDAIVLPLRRMTTLKAINNKTNIPNHKYCEIISFNRPGIYAVAIGCNPSRGSKNVFDKTNLKIAEELYKNKTYCGYILFNLFTVLTPSIAKLKTYIKNCQADLQNNFQLNLCNFLIHNKLDIYAFWGPDAKSFVNNQLKTVLQQNMHLIRYTSDSNGNFIHPCKIPIKVHDANKR